MFHNMTEKYWKEFLQAEAELGVEAIMREVNSDPSLKDVHAPEGLYDALMAQIEAYEDEMDRKVYKKAYEEYVASGCKSTPVDEFWKELGLAGEIVSFDEAKKRLKR